jgi:HAD superfamily hydrolase (TIGR01484 family)
VKYRALATDYDGTLAWHAVVTESTIDALQRFKDSGRKLLLVTGREMHELFEVCPAVQMFDLIVAENGALIYNPSVHFTRVLAAPPPDEFVDCLREKGVHPLSVGRVVIATQESFRGVIAQAIDEWELSLQIIPNKGALMVLPQGVDKASGLLAALEELHLEPSTAVGVGDAENDLAFLRICGCSVAVGNALPLVKEQVCLTTHGSRGEGVEELIGKILFNELADVPAQPAQGMFPSMQR